MTNSYQNSIIFIRDVFNYFIPGFIFCLFIYIVYSGRIPTTDNFFFTGNISIISVIIISYFIGKISNSIAFYYVKFILKIYNQIYKELFKKEIKFFVIKERTNKLFREFIPKELKFPKIIYDENEKERENEYIRSYVYAKLLNNLPNLYLPKIERYGNIGESHKTLAVLSLVFSIILFLDFSFMDHQHKIFIYAICGLVFHLMFICFYCRISLVIEKLLIIMLNFEKTGN